MKYLLLILFFFSLSNLHSQTDKNYLFRANLGYNYSDENKPDVVNGNNMHGTYNEKINDLSCSVSAGRKLKSNFNYGFGFTYNYLKDELKDDEESTDPDDSSGYSSYYFNKTNLVNTANTYSPSVFFQYFCNISDRFTFSIDLYSQYDFSVEKETNIFYSYYILSDTIINEIDNYSENKKQYFRLGLSPALRFNILDNLGIEFTFGSVEYKLKTKDSRIPEDVKKSDEFVIGFEPEDWRLGFYLKF